MKRIMLFILITMSSISLLQGNVATGYIESFITKISKMTKGKVDDVVKQIPKRSKVPIFKYIAYKNKIL